MTNTSAYLDFARHKSLGTSRSVQVTNDSLCQLALIAPTDLSSGITLGCCVRTS
ncbi:hypothetical protein [Nostoc sp. NMS2]|uniref:hypothetical protein n=1 Tax=Nostoc sp. NMS2 TaxID=2815389 RepID=UPI0025EEFBC5|nr:hypothetical protein [Nostoc sp. NMS2]